MSGENTSRLIPVARIPADGMRVTLVLSEAEREAIRHDLDLVDLTAVEATLLLRSEEGGIVDVEGRVRADLHQRCVVSLEPVAEQVDEPVAMRLVPAAATDAAADDGLGPPDSYRGHAVDLRDIVREHVALGLDPYPRAPDATLEQAEDEGAPGDAPSDASPFAALAALRGGSS